MNGGWLLLPFFLVRFGLLGLLDRQAVARAGHFAPMAGGERVAYWVYQVSTGGLILAPFFLTVPAAPLWRLVPGVALYGLGCWGRRWSVLQGYGRTGFAGKAFTAAPATPCTGPISCFLPDVSC